METGELLRSIPKVDRVLEELEIKEALKTMPRRLVVKTVQEALKGLREEILGQRATPEEVSIERVKKRVLDMLRWVKRANLRPVINATGVVVHTNLGRSPLPPVVIDGMLRVACGYSNLEYDLQAGKRGNRYTHVEGLLRDLTGAEAAHVVNNNAAAVLLSLDTLAKGREVIVSRGELIEIGGSFRIPEVMKRSGARLVEVGTTNKTRLSDYESAISSETGLLLKVHTSNYKVIGFTQSVEGRALVGLGRRYSIPVMEDLGSGCLINLASFGQEREPTVQEVVAEGIDLVTFSGDKLLGGPQAGIILGKRELVESIRRNQLARALRIDKLTLSCLEGVLRLYLDPEAAVREIPTLRMLGASRDELLKKAKRILKRIGALSAPFELRIVEGISKVGGGALPALNLGSALITILPKGVSAAHIEERLRNNDPPIITRIEKDTVMLDVRTILEEDIDPLVKAIRAFSLG